MKLFSLKRKGKEDLVFFGNLLARVDDRNCEDSLQYWVELSLYRTRVGKYILATSIHFRKHLETDFHGAVAFETAADLHEFLFKQGAGLHKVITRLLRQAEQNDRAFTAPEEFEIPFAACGQWRRDNIMEKQENVEEPVPA